MQPYRVAKFSAPRRVGGGQGCLPFMEGPRSELTPRPTHRFGIAVTTENINVGYGYSDQFEATFSISVDAVKELFR